MNPEAEQALDELKACPFCGSSNTTLDYYEISGPQELGTIVVCNDCGASAKSIVDWNTRPIEDALEAQLASRDALNARNVKATRLIEHLKSQRDRSKRAFDKAMDLVLKYDARIAELEAAQRWIPVKEKLPEIGMRVLFYNSFMKNIHKGWYSVDEWVSESRVFYDGDKLKRITHWMPLPSAPESEDE